MLEAYTPVIFPHCTISTNSPICATVTGLSLNVSFLAASWPRSSWIILTRRQSQARVASWAYIPVHRCLGGSSLGEAVKVLDSTLGRFTIEPDLASSVHCHEYLRLLCRQSHARESRTRLSRELRHTPPNTLNVLLYIKVE